MDWVIIDSERLHDIVITKFLTKRWLEYDREAVKPLCMWKSAHEVSQIQKTIYQLPDDIESMIEEKRAILFTLIDEQLDYIPGFLEYHNYLTAHWIQSVVATWSSNIALERINQKLHITNIFWTNIVTVDHVWGVGKPHPDLFNAAMKLVDKIPAECLVIEDATNGIQAAHNAWVQVIWFTSTLTSQQLSLANPTWIASSFDEIQQITQTLL